MRRGHRTLTARGILAWLVVWAAVAAACSGGGPEGAAGPTSAPTSAAPTATPTPQPLTVDEVVAGFAQAWETGDWVALETFVEPDGAAAAALHRDVHNALAVVTTAVTVQSVVDDGPAAVAELEVTLELGRLGPWTYDTTVDLVYVDQAWTIAWTPATLHPALREGRSLAQRRVWPRRGRLLDIDGAPLRTDIPVMTVGIEPQRVEDLDQLADDLAEVLDVDPDRVRADVEAPNVQPDWFVPVKTLREPEYARVAPELESLAGVVTSEGTDRRGPTEDFALQLLGSTGPITAEQLDAWGEPYDAGSVVGRSGLELMYESELAGTPSGDVRLLDAEGALVSVVDRFVGRAPLDVQTTLDIDTQLAAEAALAKVKKPAALVAIDAATGGIRAVVSHPSDGFARALSGSYPPGSTFKTVTAAAYLSQGATPATPVSCPATTTVFGRPFGNAGGSSLGRVSLETAFAKSCNTAFVNVSQELDEADLVEMAADFGFGATYTIGPGVVGGEFPPAIDDAELAASAIGQGRVSASPLHMATVAAAVADGVWRPPRLILEPAIDPGVDEVALPEDVVAALRTMMRAVVTGGTGTAVSGVGGAVAGKTGSAEFGGDDPPESHAWFIGYRDGLAFAVLVEGGGAGGAVAAPIAAEFLAALDRSG